MSPPRPPHRNFVEIRWVLGYVAFAHFVFVMGVRFGFGFVFFYVHESQTCHVL